MATDATTATIPSALAISDLSIIDDEPRIADVRLAAFLGYARVQDLRALAERHKAALLRFGEVSSYRATKPLAGSQGGRPSAGMAFNKRQALLLAGKTDLPAGVEILIQMVEVFDAVTAGRTLGTAPAAQVAAPAPLSTAESFLVAAHRTALAHGATATAGPPLPHGARLVDCRMTDLEMMLMGTVRALVQEEVRRITTSIQTDISRVLDGALVYFKEPST